MIGLICGIFITVVTMIIVVMLKRDVVLLDNIIQEPTEPKTGETEEKERKDENKDKVDSNHGRSRESAKKRKSRDTQNVAKKTADDVQIELETIQ